MQPIKVPTQKQPRLEALRNTFSPSNMTCMAVVSTMIQ